MGYAMAVVLAALMPEKGQAIMARAAVYAENRLVCSAHFRRDIVAGQTLGTAVAVMLLHNAKFRVEFGAAEAELHPVVRHHAHADPPHTLADRLRQLNDNLQRLGQRLKSSIASLIGTTIADPYVDYATVARGFGVHGEGPISDPADLAPALKRAIAVVKSGHPALIDVVTDPR